jgi:hypothetical protein
MRLVSSAMTFGSSVVKELISLAVVGAGLVSRINACCRHLLCKLCEFLKG